MTEKGIKTWMGNVMLKLLLHILLDSECLCQNHVIFLVIRMTKSFTQKKICLVELRMACSVDV